MSRLLGDWFVQNMAALFLPSLGRPVRPQSFRGDTFFWNLAADMYAWRGKDPEPRPPLLQTWAWESREPGHFAEQLIRDETSVS